MYYQRARGTVEALKAEYDQLAASGGLEPGKISDVPGMLKSDRGVLARFGSPPPELMPRPVQGDQNSPYPSYRVFDGITGQLIELGPPVGQQRRPLAGGGPQVGSEGGAGSPPSPSRGGPSAAAKSPLIGRWAGTTSNGEQVQIVVSDDGSMQFRWQTFDGNTGSFDFRWKQDADGKQFVFCIRRKDKGWVPIQWLEDDTISWRSGIPESGERFTRQ